MLHGAPTWAISTPRRSVRADRAAGDRAAGGDRARARLGLERAAGLPGERAGRDWSPPFDLVSCEMTGARVDTVGRDADARLELPMELRASGLLRQRATVTVVTGKPYTLHGQVAAMPAPRSRPRCRHGGPVGAGSGPRSGSGSSSARTCGRTCTAALGPSSARARGRHGRFRAAPRRRVHVAWSGNRAHTTPAAGCRAGLPPDPDAAVARRRRGAARQSPGPGRGAGPCPASRAAVAGAGHGV